MSALAGKRVVVTRARAQAAPMLARLSAAGAVPLALPTIAIVPAPEQAGLDAALRKANCYEWVIFTSANAVSIVWQRLSALGLDAAALAGCRVAAIGPATAAALQARGVPPTFVPPEYVAEALAQGLGAQPGEWVLMPRAAQAREALADELGRLGAVVHEIAVYDTVLPEPEPSALDAVRAGFDAVTFTSASTVRHYVDLARQHQLPLPPEGGAITACIGPITAGTARSLGLPVDVQAVEYTVDGLVNALDEHYARPKEQDR